MKQLAFTKRGASIPLLFLLALYNIEAYAAINNGGVFDSVLARYSSAASTWRAVIVNHATWLFWTLALISMIWTFGMLALRKADIGEFFAEFIRFTMFTGFFWWLLSNGPGFAVDIMNSLRQVGAQASSLGNSLSPSGIVDIGFDVFFKVIDQSSVWSIPASIAGFIIGGCILIVFALVGVNMLILLISGWILAYAGVFFLGFGGSRWTSEMAIGYFKTVLNIAGQLFTMVLIVGIGKSFVDLYYTSMSAGIELKELGVMLVVATIMLALVRTIPGLIGGLAGGNTASLGSGFGAGAALAAATMGAAALATAGSALMSGATSIAGGAQALMAAFSKANAAENTGGGGSSPTMPPAGATYVGGGGSTTNGSPLAAAMGDSGASAAASSGGAASSSATQPGGAKNFEASPSARSAEKTGAESTVGSSDTTTSETSGTSEQPPSNSNSSKGSKRSDAATGTQGTMPATSPSSAPSSDVQSSPNPGAADAKSTSEKPKSSGTKRAAAAMATKAGRLAAGTVANLAQGSWDVAIAAAAEMKESAKDRIGETVGGQIAAAIKAREAATKHGGVAATFGNDSLSAGTERADPESEIAAFRDGKPTTT